MFGQAVALYFSYWYTKSEISKRVALFIGAGALAGAFGGLISFGVAKIAHPKIEKWRVLFLIEGCPSVVLAICVFIFLPSRPQTSRYLNEQERTLAHTRLNADSLNEGNSGIDWRGVRHAFLDWKTYTIAIAYSCMNLTLGSVSGFLPTIVKGLGYTNAQAQLYTVPPYAVAFVFTMLLSTFSDKLRSRG
jgi:sugar phosphate permease